MTRLFVRLPEFEKQCKNMGFNEDDVTRIELILLGNPVIGDLIKGTGGIRKVRIPLSNSSGKSGGARVIYVDFAYYKKIYLITAYGKSVKEDLNKAEKNELKALVKILESELRKRGG
jgi:hypothetical protein